MKKVKIAGVSINLDAFKDYKSLAELKNEPLKIFEHLSKEEQDKAYADLWNELDPKKKNAEPPAAQ